MFPHPSSMTWVFHSTGRPLGFSRQTSAPPHHPPVRKSRYPSEAPQVTHVHSEYMNKAEAN